MRLDLRTADGFTLIEVLVAIAVLAIGVLALAAGAAATVRSMLDAERVGGASRTAEVERERAAASTCVASAGVDSVQGGRIAWSAAPAGAMLAVRQTIVLPRVASVDIAAAESCR